MQTLNSTITEQTIKTLLSVVDSGLVKGVGKPIPGSMCVEAAVCYALGLPHGDDPKCVGMAVRSFKINLNDSGWSSDLARAAGMRKLAVAQLGSDIIDQQKFAEYVVVQTIKRLLPITLRCAGLEKEALDCEKVGTLEQAKEAAAAAATAAAGYAAAARCATARAATAAAAATATATAATAATAARAAADAATDKDAILLLSAQIGLEALQAQNSPGCKWLYLCENPA